MHILYACIFSLLQSDVAMPRLDFVPRTSTLTFDSLSLGRVCAVVAVIIDDDIAENDEVFTVQLQAGSSVDILANGSSALVTIISDDGKPSLFQY